MSEFRWCEVTFFELKNKMSGFIHVNFYRHTLKFVNRITPHPRPHQVSLEAVEKTIRDAKAASEARVMSPEEPLVALSATIGNPEQFAHWLRGVEEAKGPRAATIAHF